jgi:hypothetical protein
MPLSSINITYNTLKICHNVHSQFPKLCSIKGEYTCLRLTDVAYSATAHVPAEQICEKMIYYTHHRYIIAPHYVSVDVS